MIDASRRSILIGVVLLIYTVLVGVMFYFHFTRMVSDAAAQSQAGSGMVILGIGALFCLVLYVIVGLQDQAVDSGSRIVQLEHRLADTEDDRTVAEQEHQKNMEKKLFEIGVINASLHREIAERIQAENESRQLHKQMELILNSAGDGIFGLDTQGRVTFANTAASLMTGWPIHELVGQPHHELVHHSFADGSPHSPEECQISQAYIDGIVHFNSDDVFWNKEGTSFPVEYVSTPITDNALIRGAVVVFRDRSIFT